VAIDRAQVRHVARLARLALSEEEEERFAAQLGQVLEYVERLQAVDVPEVEPLSFARRRGGRPSLPRTSCGLPPARQGAGAGARAQCEAFPGAQILE